MQAAGRGRSADNDAADDDVSCNHRRVIDGIATPLEDVLFVEVDRFVGGQTIIQELHWKLVDGTWTWFSDCGEPLDR